MKKINSKSDLVKHMIKPTLEVRKFDASLVLEKNQFL